MRICYVDESGDLGALPAPPGPNDQPVLVLGGLFVDTARLEALTNSFLVLKHRFFPGLAYPSSHHLDRIIPEIKGADLRRNALQGNRNQRRHAYGFIDKTLSLLEHRDVRLVTRIWVKVPGAPFDHKAVYTSSIQAICTYFEEFLVEKNDVGFCIADCRNKSKNVNVSHSIFTQKFQAATSYYSRLLELPTFGHSDNHVGLQLCDILCSALLFPIACEAYCTGSVANVHVQPTAALLKVEFGTRLKNLQYRFQDPAGRHKGGIVVSDPSGRNATLMFK
ncbi:MAG: DUF3800 domain-containing protein [Capsulimonadaceae bacterium]